MRHGMVINLNRCIGCHACSLACKIENATGPGIHWSQVFLFEDGHYPEVRRAYLPRLCMHCANPACVTVCPTGATYKASDGFVLVDEDKCIGCQACILACPYEARHMNNDAEYFPDRKLSWGEAIKNHRSGTVGKCNFCFNLVSQGLKPACVDACPTEARIFGDLADSTSDVSRLIEENTCFQIQPELNLNPSVYYIVPKYFIFTDQPENDLAAQREGKK